MTPIISTLESWSSKSTTRNKSTNETNQKPELVGDCTRKDRKPDEWKNVLNLAEEHDKRTRDTQQPCDENEHLSIISKPPRKLQKSKKFRDFHKNPTDPGNGSGSGSFWPKKHGSGSGSAQP